jgi:parallel beta-helix repeat protein
VKSLLSSRRISIGAAVVVASGAVAVTPAMAKTLYVTPKGKNAKTCTAKKPCKSISFAVGKAARGDTVAVATGTYRDSVKITKDIALAGIGRVTVNAQGRPNGILITGAKAAGARVTGLTVENATDEGILAMLTSNVTITDNVVKNNDRGVSAKTPTGECAAQGQVPGDCGEGLHLMSVSNSQVLGNLVQNNLGGILLTDELGPTADNLIALNKSLNNLYDCGITLAGHNTAAYAGGSPVPSKGGVFDNIVYDNTANNDGTKGLGGGIIVAAGAPGSAVYGNTVEDNVANGNGLGGFTLHSHSPGQYLNDNRVIDNTFLNDAIAGNPGNKPGDVDAGITQTAGIIVYSAVTPLSGTVISGNNLGNEYYGIWTQNVPQISQSANNFGSGVTIDVSQR